MDETRSTLWHGRTAVIATMHHKEQIIGPCIQAELGLSYVVPEQFNSDAFGTFTRDIPRVADQLETARRKAKAAMQQTGHTIGLASEGSFGAHPNLPFVTSNLELVVLIDSEHELEIVGHYRTGAVQVQSKTVSSVAEAVTVATAWGFPEQGVIVRTSETNTRNMYKDITTVAALEATAHRLLSSWFRSNIFLETDMRAHRCPPRRTAIKQAALDLIQNCQSLCPQCNTPGFVITDIRRGVPCAACGLPTDLPLTTIWKCKKCQYVDERPATDEHTTSPAHCERCNP